MSDELKELKEEFKKLRYMLYIWFRFEREKQINETRYKEALGIFKEIEKDIKKEFGLNDIETIS